MAEATAGRSWKDGLDWWHVGLLLSVVVIVIAGMIGGFCLQSGVDKAQKTADKAVKAVGAAQKTANNAFVGSWNAYNWSRKAEAEGFKAQSMATAASEAAKAAQSTADEAKTAATTASEAAKAAQTKADGASAAAVKVAKEEDKRLAFRLKNLEGEVAKLKTSATPLAAIPISKGNPWAGVKDPNVTFVGK